MRRQLLRCLCAVVAMLTLSATSSHVQAAPQTHREMRCGWIDNPTPANWWLTDRDGEWIIGAQGGRQAEGMDNLPDFSGNWVETNGHYGYGCACLNVDVDAHAKQVMRIYGAKQKPLSVCKADKALPPRGN